MPQTAASSIARYLDTHARLYESRQHRNNETHSLRLLPFALLLHLRVSFSGNHLEHPKERCMHVEVREPRVPPRLGNSSRVCRAVSVSNECVRKVRERCFKADEPRIRAVKHEQYAFEERKWRGAGRRQHVCEVLEEERCWRKGLRRPKCLFAEQTP